MISWADSHWQPELSAVEVAFHLLRGLAFGYHAKTDADTVIEGSPMSKSNESYGVFKIPSGSFGKGALWR